LREFEDSWSNSADNLVRLGAMDFAELLERAHHYRMMAIRVTDDQTREGLLELAEQYEALASRMEQSRAESNDQ
jgi:hypothetical protein